MGKRKAARKPGKKAKLQPLDKIFRCLFCQHAGCVHAKMDRQEMVSRIECSRCAQWFETKIDHLTEPIDVYSLWIDATELANRPSTQNGASSNQRHHKNNPDGSRSHTSSSRRPNQEDAPAEDFDPDDDDADLPDHLF